MSDWQHGFYKADPQARRERLTQALHLPQSVTKALADHASTLGNELVENYLTGGVEPHRQWAGVRCPNGRGRTLGDRRSQ